MLRFNKVCEIDDFADPEVVTLLHELYSHRHDELPTGFPRGFEDRSDWETAMSLRTLRQFGAVTPDATLLGVAAGSSDLPFHLARQVRQVFAVDRYLDMAGAAPETALWRMIHPEDFSPFPVDTTRLIFQHMDPTFLRFPDATFDGVFCGRTTGLHRLADAAHLSFEMGRVLKVGGVLSMAVELRIAGPPGATGAPAGLSLSRENVARFVVAASGLEPVDEVQLQPSSKTLETRRELAFASRDRSPEMSEVHPTTGYPRLVAVRDGYVSMSAQLTLEKTERYPSIANEWAAPPMSTADHISGRDRIVVGLR